MDGKALAQGADVVDGCRSNTYESPTKSSMWSRSNRTTNRAISEVDVEVAIEAIMADAAEIEEEGVGGVAVVAVGEEVPEERRLKQE